MGGASMKGTLPLARRPLRGDKCTRDENRMLQLPIIRCFHGARSVAAKSIGSVAILKEIQAYDRSKHAEGNRNVKQ